MLHYNVFVVLLMKSPIVTAEHFNMSFHRKPDLQSNLFLSPFSLKPEAFSCSHRKVFAFI